MRVLNESVEISAAVEQVWAVLADFGGVDEWAPYMVSCELSGDVTSGVGMRRSMRHAWGFRFEEVVTDWTEGRGFSFDVLRTPYPMKDVRESWVISASNGKTMVATEVTYAMFLQPLGPALDWGMVRFIVRREMRAGLLGLKQYIEQHKAH